jgi:hypothetical protein
VVVDHARDHERRIRCAAEVDRDIPCDLGLGAAVVADPDATELELLTMRPARRERDRVRRELVAVVLKALVGLLAESRAIGRAGRGKSVVGNTFTSESPAPVTAASAAASETASFPSSVPSAPAAMCVNRMWL